MDVIDVVPHVRDRRTAMSLLKSTKAPFRAHCSRPLPSGSGYLFTTADVEEFISTRRADLAELVIEGTSDVNVLYDVSRMKASVALLKAVCRNKATPADILLVLLADSRKGVQAAATSALANHMTMVVRYAEEPVHELRDLVFCPNEELATRLAAFMNRWSTPAVNYALECVFSRVEPVTDEAWALLTPRWLGIFARPGLVKLVAQHPRATVETLEEMLSALRFRRHRAIVREELLARYEPGSEQWLRTLVDCDYGSLGLGHQQQAALLSPDQARELLAEGGMAAEVAVVSGRLTDQDIAAWAHKWAESLPEGGLAPLELLSSPAVSGATLEACLVRSDLHGVARSALARNPNLAPEFQLKLAGNQDAAQVLATNPSLTLEAAERIVDVCLGGGDASSAHAAGYVPWRSQATLVALLANEHLPCEARMSIPAVALMKPRVDTKEHLVRAVAFLDEQLGYEPEPWRTFLGLLPEWEGTVKDLVGVVTTL